MMPFFKARVLRGLRGWAAFGGSVGADRFVKASTHWLRYTHPSHTIVNDLPAPIAQKNLDHASLATTSMYVTTE